MCIGMQLIFQVVAGKKYKSTDGENECYSSHSLYVSSERCEDENWKMWITIFFSLLLLLLFLCFGYALSNKKKIEWQDRRAIRIERKKIV